MAVKKGQPFQEEHESPKTCIQKLSIYTTTQPQQQQ